MGLGNIGVYDLRTLAEKLVDDTAYRLFVARYRGRRDYNAVARRYLDLLVSGKRHAVKRAHLLALASGRYYAHLVLWQLLELRRIKFLGEPTLNTSLGCSIRIDIILNGFGCPECLIDSPSILFGCEENEKDVYEDDFMPKYFILAVIPALIIGVWFYLSPVSPEACYKMADSLHPTFTQAAHALIRKGQTGDPDFKRLEDLSFELEDK